MSDLVELREPVASDKKIIFEWISDPEIRKMTGTKSAPTKERHEIWFNNKLNDKNNLFRIITFNSIPVGIAGTNEITENRTADIYIYLGNPQFRRKGIATSALQVLIGMLFKERYIHKINARVFSYNQPSINLFEKLGFSCEGLQKEQILFEDKYYDLIIFGLVNSEN